jgi:hypothetical protein
VSSSSSAAAADPLLEALQTVRTLAQSDAEYVTAITTLGKILANIIDHPMEEKYRTVKKSNAAFQKRLGGVPGGHDVMIAAGFVVETTNDTTSTATTASTTTASTTTTTTTNQAYVIHPSADAWPRLVATKAVIDDAVRAAQQQHHQQQQQQQRNIPSTGTTGNSNSGNNFSAGAVPRMDPMLQGLVHVRLGLFHFFALLFVSLLMFHLHFSTVNFVLFSSLC